MELRTTAVTDFNMDKDRPPVCPTANTTSQKHKNFVVEPMKEKSVKELAGIGLVLGGRLEEKGFTKAKDVLGQFLLLKQDKVAFKCWMRQACFAGNRQSEDCYRCLREWCDAFL
ncbi:barrier-to-autointegration factor B-like [Carcharodon carcharias]|uniref:barrier-to-autointegration factor B-like n=1 Tax=Carcharodon carcharias TaxID=13397 RepID=UPI001B7E1C4C|nr:barrier-to-autointegration factor B-like [Carcharodon carcharias]